MRGGDDSQAGVGDDGHAGVGDHQDAPARPGGVEKLLDAPLFVVVEVGDDPPADLHPQRRRQLAGPAGVLGGDDVGLAQRRPEPVGGVADVAQRRGGQGDARLEDPVPEGPRRGVARRNAVSVAVGSHGRDPIGPCLSSWA